MKFTVIIFILLSLLSCGQTADQKVADAIDQAQTFLTDGDCDKALDVLGEAGGKLDNATYIQVLSSAYACKADFNLITFIADDIESLETGSFSQLMKSISTLTYSDESTPDSDKYKAMGEALQTLLQDGSVAPSQKKREATFGPRKAGDIGIQILTYSLVQLGKFVNLYGNVNSSGVKGAGSGTNDCFLTYSYAPAIAVRNSQGGSCDATHTAGHSGLSNASPNEDRGNRRRCEGLMLFTNILDVLENLDVSENDTYKDLSAVSTQLSASIDLATAVEPNLKTLLGTTSQKKCEKLLETQAQSDYMELLFASLFETGLQ